jgi:hypothetical protein
MGMKHKSREDFDRVPLPDCVKGRVYELRCRNLGIGVFDGKDGFIGIRTKFATRFLDTEHHWDTGAPYGTVAGVVDMGIDLPDNIEATETIGTVDEATDRPVRFDRPIADGGLGWIFTDTDEPDASIMAVRKGNPELFNFLEKLENER